MEGRGCRGRWLMIDACQRADPVSALVLSAPWYSYLPLAGCPLPAARCHYYIVTLLHCYPLPPSALPQTIELRELRLNHTGYRVIDSDSGLRTSDTYAVGKLRFWLDPAANLAKAVKTDRRLDPLSAHPTRSRVRTPGTRCIPNLTAMLPGDGAEMVCSPKTCWETTRENWEGK
jgi:hypothetical protein